MSGKRMYSKTERAILAVNKSIRHWERMARGRRVKMRDLFGRKSLERPTGSQCQCCRDYKNCIGCPVYIYADEKNCGKQLIYMNAYGFSKCGMDSQLFMDAATHEVRFLKRVLTALHNDEIILP